MRYPLFGITGGQPGQVPYKPGSRRDIKLPKRQPAGGYVPPDLPLRRIPAPF
jgi:hypothetical protein